MSAAGTSGRVRAFVVLLLALVSLAMASCQEGRVFGMSLGEFEKLLSAGDASPFLKLDEKDLGNPGALGASGYYYLALWAESASLSQDLPDADKAAFVRRLLRMAFDQGSGIVKRRSVYALMERLEAAALYQELLELTASLDLSQSKDWRYRKAYVTALYGTGAYTDALEEVQRLRIAFPDESTMDADALDCIEAGSLVNDQTIAKRTRAAAALRRILLERPGSKWTSAALSIADDAMKRGIPSFLSENEARIARMRVAVLRKEYSKAYADAAALDSTVLGMSAVITADAGKAYLYSGHSAEGKTRFENIETAARKAGATATAWNALFYQGRFARELGRWSEAKVLFLRAVEGAREAGASQPDTHAALWYGTECAGKAALAEAARLIAQSKAKEGSSLASRAEAAARAQSLDALIDASRVWTTPEEFSDLCDELLRSALRARDWALVERMNSELAPRLSPVLKARVAYISTRALQLGLSKVQGETSADARMSALVRDETLPLYYRILASWVSQEATSLIPEDAAIKDANKKPSEIETFICGFIDFGLGSMASSEARASLDLLEPEELRRISRYLAEKGQHDYSIRVAGLLLEKKGYSPVRDDFFLLYPRPYLRELRAVSHDSDERAFFTRSCSIRKRVRADIVSSAGAVGLTQLMPATAAERAKALKMENYDLRLPHDNLRLGLSHMSYLIDRTGSLVRAVMAYNAGLSRLRTWVSEGSDLPDDLLVESITIAETRQYCRNILQAAAVYGELYEGVPPGVTAGKIIVGR
jgi:soluble lytic murein transglycosylase